MESTGERFIPDQAQILDGVFGWLDFPLKHLDQRLNHRPEASPLAAAFYYLGRKLYAQKFIFHLPTGLSHQFLYLYISRFYAMEVQPPIII